MFTADFFETVSWVGFWKLWHFWRAKKGHCFCLNIYSKNVENKMNFEIHMITLSSTSMSFGLQKPLFFWTIDIFFFGGGCWKNSDLNKAVQIKKSSNRFSRVEAQHTTDFIR